MKTRATNPDHILHYNNSYYKSPSVGPILTVVNVHDAEIPVCKSQKVLGIIINEVLDRTGQIKGVAKRLNYGPFVRQKILKVSSVKGKNSM